jgi:hypothetical protein
MITLCLGRRELGKTTLADYFTKARRPRLILDPRAQFDPDASDVLCRDVTKDGDAILDGLGTGRTVIVQPVRPLQAHVDALGVIVESYLLDDKTRELSILFDEARLYKLEEWDWVLRCAPRKLTTFVFTAHRPKDINTDIRALADMLCLFQMTQQHDLVVIEERCGPEVAAKLTSLQSRQFVSWDDVKAISRVHLNPATWGPGSREELAGVPLERRGLLP